MPKNPDLIQIRVNMTPETRHHLAIIAAKEGRSDSMQATVMLREAISRQIKTGDAAKLPPNQANAEPEELALQELDNLL